MADAAPSLPTYETLADAIEHVALHPAFTDEDVEEQCRIAREYAVAAILVRPIDIDHAVRSTSWSQVAVASVAGYPNGISTTGTKLYEGRDLLRRGAKEIDFVINPGKLRSRQFQHVELELLQIAESCREAGARLKVVLHNTLLDHDLKIIAAKIARRAQADFLSITATDADLEVFRPLLKNKLQLKAAGPVRTLDEAWRLLQAGCTRIATDQTPALLDAWKQRLRELRNTEPESSLS